MRRPSTARVVVLVVCCMASSCGTTAKAPAPPVASVPSTVAEVVLTARFCDLANQLYGLAAEKDLVGPTGLLDGPGDALAALVAAMGVTLDELALTAPAAVRTKAASLVAGLRAAAAGDPAALETPDYRSAGQAVADARRATCTVDPRPSPGVAG